VASGANTFQYTDNGTTTVPFHTLLNPYLVGEYRIIGMGFEVINTTAELNLQGLVTCYRQPMNAIDSAKSDLVTTGPVPSGGGTVFTLNAGYFDLVQTNTPPATPGEALLLDGSKQWKAKEGAYVVSTLNSPENPAGMNNTTPVLHLSSLDPQISTNAWVLVEPASSLPAGFQGSGFTIGPNTFTIDNLPTGCNWMAPFNHSGAYFTGLSNSTTLQVNAIYYVERFPSQQDSALVVLARESCHADCVALDLYSEITREMPVGVPQRMNGMGEWFADAVSSAVDFVAPVLSAIPLPMAQTIGAGMRTVGNIAKSLGTKKESPGQTYAPTGNNVSASVPKKKKKVVQPTKKMIKKG